MKEILAKYQYSHPIIVLDSGIGGINIANYLHEQLPAEDIIAIIDTKHMPYGDLSRRQLLDYMKQILELVKNLAPKMIVIGCNTIDALIGDYIEAEFNDISVIRIIKQSAIKAMQVTKTNQIAVFATPNTIESQAYMLNMLGRNGAVEVYGISCQQLAQLIENQDFSNPDLDAEIKMAQDLTFDTLVLGCTHYGLVMHKFKKYYPQVEIIDSSLCVSDYVVRKLPLINRQHRVATHGYFDVLVSEVSTDLMQTIKRINSDVEVHTF